MIESKDVRGRKNFEVGVVVSDKMDKTVSVEVYRLAPHAKYNKYIRSKSVFKAHDEKGQAKLGDKVKIMEDRPLSKTKRWRLVEVLEKAKQQDLGVGL